MRDAVSGLTRFKYSMNLVSLSKFAAAGKLTTHEQMRDAGALTPDQIKRQRGGTPKIDVGKGTPEKKFFGLF